MHVVIIGGGIAGLVAAYTLAKEGARITLLEAADRLGGLAGAFTIEPGVEIERYYHFICKPDKHYFEMLNELGIGDRLRWVTTDMGLFHNGALRRFGDPLSLFAHPDLSPAAKLRFAMASVRAKLRSTRGWSALEDRTAVEWLVGTFGGQVYDLLYRPLLEKKFRTFAPRISAAWMWSRLNRLGNSRTVTQRERIGYLVGGSQSYIDALTAALTSAGVDIRVGATAREVVLEGSRVSGVRHDRGSLPADFVLLTVPIPHAAPLLAGLDHEYFANLRSLAYLNVLVVVLRLSRQFSSHFWTNVSDPRIDLPGFIEFTNLNPRPELRGDAVLYMPQYLMDEHPFLAHRRRRVGQALLRLPRDGAPRLLDGVGAAELGVPQPLRSADLRDRLLPPHPRHGDAGPEPLLDRLVPAPPARPHDLQQHLSRERSRPPDPRPGAQRGRGLNDGGDRESPACGHRGRRHRPGRHRDGTGALRRQAVLRAGGRLCTSAAWRCSRSSSRVRCAGWCQERTRQPNPWPTAARLRRPFRAGRRCSPSSW